MVARGSFSYAVSAGGSVALESVAHSEGRIYVGTPDGDMWDCWNVTDHLGNVRSVVNPDGSGSEYLLEQSDYLPFGLRLNQSSPLLSDLQRWHYAGKEYQKFGSTDLGLIDFGARYYSPFLCRWSTIDPLASKYLATSPYGYCGSNPMNFVDPDGRKRVLKIDKKTKTIFVVATIYYQSNDLTKNSILKKYTTQAANVINSQSGTYTDRKGRQYTVKFHISVKEADGTSTDPEVKGYKNANVITFVEENAMGRDENGNQILSYTRNDIDTIFTTENNIKDKTVIAHEIGHLLGAGLDSKGRKHHSKEGLMQASKTKGQSELFLPENYIEIIRYGKGKRIK